jgi:hypothetical protein
MSDEQTELLRQILAMQQEQLAFAKQNAANFQERELLANERQKRLTLIGSVAFLTGVILFAVVLGLFTAGPR